MTPLEAARRIAATDPTYETYQGPHDCIFCDGTLYSQQDIFPITGHKDDCPWLAMPRIIAILEASETIVNSQWCRDVLARDAKS